MAKAQKFVNPFYILLVIVGVAFVITACSYGVMAYRDVSMGGIDPVADNRGLIGFMERHGVMLLGIEVGLLGLFTIGAIGTDDFWRRRLAQPGDAVTRRHQDNEHKSDTVAEITGDHSHES